MSPEPSLPPQADLFDHVPRAIPPQREEDWNELYYLLGSTFSPHQPINERELFVGRVRSVGQALKKMGIEIAMTSFGRNLEQFCSLDRGPTLIREGLPKNYQYYFDYPLLKPFTIIKGLSEGLIRPDQLV